jgi:hypothetical protein
MSDYRYAWSTHELPTGEVEYVVYRTTDPPGSPMSAPPETILFCCTLAAQAESIASMLNIALETNR